MVAHLSGFCKKNRKGLYFPDHAAGDLLSGITGRLGVKIIGMAVDHHRPTNDFLRRKTSCQYRKIRISTKTQQRRKITCMPGMFRSGRIKMSSGIGESLAPAISSFMDMKPIKACVRLRQAVDFCNNNCPTPVGIKLHYTRDA